MLSPVQRVTIIVVVYDYHGETMVGGDEFVKRRILVGSAALLSFFIPSAFGQSASRIDFQTQVYPILAAKCIGCHGQARRDGGLSLSNYSNALEGGRSGAAINPGDGKASLLMQRIRGETQPRMPLGGLALSETEVATLRTWIDEGARPSPTEAPAKPKWQAPLTLSHPAVPELTWKNWDAPIDRFVAAYLANQGVREPQSVADAQFARRAYLDIWGLLPDPEGLRTFVKDTAPGKREKLITSLLRDDTKYAEHWISFWNDLLRNDEGVTYHSEEASRKSITEWLLNSLKLNLPYDQFVAKLLNPTGPVDPEGFLIGVNWRGTVSASQTPAMQAAQNTAQVFLGVNLKCNACHDSFISKWKLKQAYAMASYFSKEPKLQLFRCDIAQQEFAQPAFLFPELDRTPPSASLADRRATAAAIFTDARNGRLLRTLVNRIWQRLLGHGLVNDPDDMDGEPWNPALLDWLASDFVEHGYDIKRLIGAIISSRAYQLSAVPRTGDQPRQYSFRGPEIRRLTAEQVGDAIGAITGEWHTYQPSSVASPTAPARTQSVFTREWRVAASPLSRALGRPIRDQVYSIRETNATTLQALELTNGFTLTHWLGRGARKMLGELPPEPVSIFDLPIRGRSATVPFNIEITGAKKLWLLVQDIGSYSPELVEAVWSGVELVGSAGVRQLSSFRAVDQSGFRTSAQPTSSGENSGRDLRVKTPSRLVYEITAEGYTHMRGSAGLENKIITSDVNPQVRFFIFREEPNMDRLTPVAAATPLPAGPPLKSATEIVDRVFWYALGRAPSAAERSLAEPALQDPSRLGRVSSEGLANLLWAVLMKPEFQLIY